MRKDLENSETFLKSTLKGNNGFLTPNNYFSEFNNDLFLRVLEDKLPKKHGFTVKDNYFNNFETKNSQTKISKKNKVFSLISSSSWIAIAAIFIVGLYINLFHFNDNIKKIDIEDITQIDVEYWLENSSYLTSSNTLDLFFNDVNFEDISFDFTDISDEDIEEYLLNSTIDFNDI